MTSRHNRHSMLPPIAAVSHLTRRLSNRIKPRLRRVEPISQTGEDETDELPFSPSVKPRQLDAETEEITRQSFELERTLEDWGVEFQDLHAEVEMVSKEHAKSTGMRSLLRSESTRRRRAQVEYHTARTVQSVYLENSERTLQDVFVAGGMTLDEYEHSMEYLQRQQRLPPSPKHPPATSFRVQRRSYQETTSATYSQPGLSASAESYQTGRGYGAPYSLHSEPRGAHSRCASQARFYVANPSPSSSSEELHVQARS